MKYPNYALALHEADQRTDHTKITYSEALILLDTLPKIGIFTTNRNSKPVNHPILGVVQWFLDRNRDQQLQQNPNQHVTVDNESARVLIKLHETYGS